MPDAFKCPGLLASWINGWLAAVGATVLDSRLRLHWTEGASPVAVLSAGGEDPIAILHKAWPSTADLEDLPIAENWGEAGQLKRKVPVEDFMARVRAARSHEYSWALSSTLTDLCVDKNGEVAHARFDPAGPGTIKWLHHRLLKVHKKVEELSAEELTAWVENRLPRVQDNGLGFDQARLGSLADDTKPYVHPVVEVLAFYGLSVLPVRGKGRDGDTESVQRGWQMWPPGRDGPKRRMFLWPAWRQPLDRHGIDALLDAWVRSHKSMNWKDKWALLGVHSAWRIVSYQPRGGSADRTRAYGSERL